MQPDAPALRFSAEDESEEDVSAGCYDGALDFDVEKASARAFKNCGFLFSDGGLREPDNLDVPRRIEVKGMRDFHLCLDSVPDPSVGTGIGWGNASRQDERELEPSLANRYLPRSPQWRHVVEVNPSLLMGMPVISRPMLDFTLLFAEQTYVDAVADKGLVAAKDNLTIKLLSRGIIVSGERNARVSH